jgi:cyclase
LTGAVVCGAALPAGAATGLQTQSLTEGVILISGAGANVVAMDTTDGAILIDGGLREQSAHLIDTVLSSLTVRRVATLFNTHWHPEQSGSNEQLGRGGTAIIAHENTKLWLDTDAPVPLTETTYGPLPRQALPTRTTYGMDTLTAGAETIEFGHVREAHTDGDLYVRLRNANVLAVGGVACSDRWPIIDYRTGGWIGGLAAGTKQLAKLADEKTIIVPAHGPVLTRAQLVAQADMYQQLFERTIQLLTKGLSPDEAVAASPTRGLMPEWGDPSTFVAQAFKSLWRHHAPDA